MFQATNFKAVIAELKGEVNRCHALIGCHVNEISVLSSEVEQLHKENQALKNLIALYEKELSQINIKLLNKTAPNTEFYTQKLQILQQLITEEQYKNSELQTENNKLRLELSAKDVPARTPFNYQPAPFKGSLQSIAKPPVFLKCSSAQQIAVCQQNVSSPKNMRFLNGENEVDGFKVSQKQSSLENLLSPVLQNLQHLRICPKELPLITQIRKFKENKSVSLQQYRRLLKEFPFEMQNNGAIETSFELISGQVSALSGACIVNAIIQALDSSESDLPVESEIFKD